MSAPDPEDGDARERAFHAAALGRGRLERIRRAGVRLLRLPPPLLLLVLYAGLVAVGACLLMLPFAATSPTTTWGEAIFTSASAVTVTGLAVVDTGSHFTFFGEAVILVLIHLGGLGLMTFAVLVLNALGMPVGIARSLTLREDLGQTSLHGLAALVKTIAVVFAIAETTGTALLAVVFVPDYGWGEGLWFALFHTVSAFNNAGFGLLPDSLTRYAVDPVVNLTVPALVIAGGLGFVVIADLWRHRRWSPLMLHSKLMLIGTAALLVWGTATFAALEWTNPATLGAFPNPLQRLTVSWFQGVTPRTAGFNTIDYAHVHDATAFMTITLMLVGGGAASTAGGIKVTTFLALLLATVAFFRRRHELTAFGRSIPLEDVLHVLAVVAVAILFVAVSIFLVLVSHDGDFLDLLFEVASAFGTVGLSRGATAELDALGRTVIIALMFAGRVGPLTLGFFLATRTAPRVRYPKSPVLLG